MCIANAQLHGFICTWTHNLMEVLPYRQHLSILLHVHECVLLLGHLGYSGDLLLRVGVRRRASSVNIFFSKTSGPILTKFAM